MSIFSGSTTIKRMKILVPPQKVSFESILEKLHSFRISALEVADTRENSVGFCHPTTGEPEITDPYALVSEKAFVFGMRIDQKKIPSTFLKIHYLAAIKAYEATLDNGVKVGKKIKDAIKQRLEEELLRSTLPSVKLIEIVWWLDSNEIWLTSMSGSSLAAFEELFQKAFGFPYVFLNPGTAILPYEYVYLNIPLDLKVHLELMPVSSFASRSQKSQQMKLESGANRSLDVF